MSFFDCLTFNSFLLVFSFWWYSLVSLVEGLTTLIPCQLYIFFGGLKKQFHMFLMFGRIPLGQFGGGSHISGTVVRARGKWKLSIQSFWSSRPIEINHTHQHLGVYRPWDLYFMVTQNMMRNCGVGEVIWYVCSELWHVFIVFFSFFRDWAVSRLYQIILSFGLMNT